MTPTTAGELRSLLAARVEPDRLRWLDEAVATVRRDRSALARVFPAVGRRLGRDLLVPADSPGNGPGDGGGDGPANGPRNGAGDGGATGSDTRATGDPHGWTVDDAGRALLLLAATPLRGAELGDLYRFGDAAERRGVLRALGVLPADAAPGGLELVHDAIRTNDPRLLAAALGPYALDRLDDDALDQAVLKCVFVGVPLAALPGDRLARRATPRLARMLAGYARERVAAGRDVPPDIWPLVDAHPPHGELAAIEADLGHPVPDRRAAAAAALAERERQARHLGRNGRDGRDGGPGRCASSNPTST